MKINIYSVIVHSCQLEFKLKLRKSLVTGERYVSMGFDSPWYLLMPKKCRCRKAVTSFNADELIGDGVAEPIWRVKKRLLEIDYNNIWMAQQRQVPRVDLISDVDIERAYIDETESSIEYIEEIHKLYMENRAKMIVPFQDDPTEGRLLFPFCIDQRTKGGHNG